MELEFDKEINALLRQTAKQDLLFAENDLQTAHLDADEISAFAENKLPEKAKLLYTEHLANCDPCRKSLSELVKLNSEFEIEPVESVGFAPAAIETPWYRKLFVFPGLAYAMGGLVVAFTGLTAFVILQNYNSGSFELAKQETSLEQTKPAVSTKEDSLIDSNSMNMAANTATESLAAQNSNSALAPIPEIEEENSISARNQNGPSPGRDFPSVSRADGKSQNEGVIGTAQPTVLPGIVSETKPADKTVSDDRMMDAESKLESSPPANPAPRPEPRKAEELAKKDRVLTTRGGEMDSDEKENKLKSPSGTRQTGGKTFNLSEGVWYDSAYQNQKTKNVRRGTDEYRKLDSGLRAVADKFTETVVVVWKQTAYRIQ